MKSFRKIGLNFRKGLLTQRIRGGSVCWKSFLCQILFSLVTMRTLTVWSKALQTHSPLLSGLQSRLEIGWVDKVTFCRRLTEPATPISIPSESFFERWAGYSLETKRSRIHLRNTMRIVTCRTTFISFSSCSSFSELRVDYVGISFYRYIRQRDSDFFKAIQWIS